MTREFHSSRLSDSVTARHSTSSAARRPRRGSRPRTTAPRSQSGSASPGEPRDLVFHQSPLFAGTFQRKAQLLPNGQPCCSSLPSPAAGPGRGQQTARGSQASFGEKKRKTRYPRLKPKRSPKAATPRLRAGGDKTSSAALLPGGTDTLLAGTAV